MSAARQDLDAIRQRADSATAGPWVYVGKNAIDTPPIEVDEADWGPDEHQGLRIHTAQGSRAYRYADAEFIAAARTDVPRLVAALTAALDLHRADSDGDCIACGVDTWEEAIPWPCETVRAITAALTPKENDS